jgi:serine/threonine protein phosphatase 1
MRRIAVADIHGCHLTFRKLIEKRIKLTKEDELYLLGDYINKGPDSKGVLDYLFYLIDNGFQLKMIRGNHDQMLIEMDNAEYKERWESDDDLKETLKSFRVQKPEDIPGQYRKLLEEMPYYLQTEDYYLVHAGFDFESKDPFSDYQSMINIRQFAADPYKTGGKKIIHGHTPIPLQEIIRSIENRKEVINIDAGCSKNDDPNYGHLVALNIDTLEIMHEPYDEA